VKRISASVLLDEMVQWQGSGKSRKRVLVAIPQNQMAAIRDLVSGALGLQKDRDQLVLESLPFEQTVSGTMPDDSSPAPSHSLPQFLNSDHKIYIFAGAGLAVVLGVIATLFLTRRRSERVNAEPQRALSSGAPAASATVAEQPSLPVQEVAAVLASHQLPPVEKKAEVVRDRLRETVANDPTFVVNVLRSWLDEDPARMRERST
jgi:flagellar biosynthesis/type III secretory pathway M-ring protein FliF/YscJ